MLTLKQAKEFAESKGFPCHIKTSNNGNFHTFTGDTGMFLDVNLKGNTVAVASRIGTVKVDTGWFQFDHPDHDKLFQNKVQDILQAIDAYGIVLN